MFEVGAWSDAVAALVAISFFSFLAGLVLRKWPEKIREYVEDIDGSVLFLSREAHRAMIDVCGRALILISVATLLAATFIV